MVATAAPPLPVAAATEAEDVGRMCQQLRQCVRSCQLNGVATTCGQTDTDQSDPTTSPIQVT